MPDRVPVILHEGIEPSQVHGLRQALLHILIEHFPKGQQTRLVQLPLRVGNGFAIYLHDHGQAMLPTQSVGNLAYLLIIRLCRAMVFLPCLEADGVDRNVVMYVPLVHMSAEHGFIVGEVFSDEPDAQLMGQLRRDLPRRKALDDVKGLDAVRLPVSLLRRPHLTGGGFWVAVLTVGKHFIVGLVPILNVPDQPVKAHVLGKDLGYRHVFSHSRMSRSTC